MTIEFVITSGSDNPDNSDNSEETKKKIDLDKFEGNKEKIEEELHKMFKSILKTIYKK